MSETIVGVALRVGLLMVSLPRPKRHGDAMREMGKQGFNYIAGPEDQGFLTSKGRFVDRIEAGELALASKSKSPN